MANPTIIFGAGASFDYVAEGESANDSRWKPPVTSMLFDSTRFEPLLKNYAPYIGPLAGSIMSEVRSGEGDLERLLAKLHDEAATLDSRQRQIIAARYYLRDLLLRVSREYRQTGNNYTDTVGRCEAYINSHPEEEIALVTFNYDLLLDFELYAHTEKTVKSFTRAPLRYFKLHGSCDWVSIPQLSRNAGAAGLFQRHDNHAFQALMDDPYILTHGMTFTSFPERRETFEDRIPVRDQDLPIVPRIAIPVHEKEVDDWMIEEPEVEVLASHIRKSTKILMVGWKAGDPALIGLLKSNLLKEAKVWVVSSRLSEAEEVAERIALGDRVVPMKANGYSHFMSLAESHAFFE